MDTGVIIAIVVGALVLIAAIAIASKMARERRLEGKREEAREVRHEAQLRGAQADRQRAEAEERAARARKEQAIADQQAAEADKHGRFARERHEEARSLDPDADDEEAARGEHAERERR
ncbi:MAG TPA: hypothetical protein VHG69_03750 [Thermoleophilaceae bacterium]|nr:hypothetical protein [Thermoleophilaceae bacterium]